MMNSRVANETLDRVSIATQRFTLISTHLIMLGLVAILVISGLPQSLELRFNVFALLSGASLISNLTALVLISRLKYHTEPLLWFSLHVASLLFWSVAETMARLSSTPQAAIFWTPYYTLGATFMAMSFFMFTLEYIGSRHAHQPISFLGLMLTPLLFIYLDTTTELQRRYAPESLSLTPWGYITTTGPVYFLVIVFIAIMISASFILLFRFRQKTIEPRLRRQSSLFMLAIGIPLVGGFITEGVLPILNIVAIPPMTVVLASLMGLTICYGIIKYRFFTITPELIAAQIVDTMNEAVIGVGPDLQLNYANTGAQRLLGYSAGQLLNRHLNELTPQQLSTNELQKGLFGAMSNSDYHTIDSMDFRTATNGLITAKVSLTKLHTGNTVDGYLMVLTDISAIAHATAIIERQVAIQTKALSDTKAKLVSSINSLELGFIITDTQPEVAMINFAAHKLFCPNASNKQHDANTCHQVRLRDINLQLTMASQLARATKDCLNTQQARVLKTTDTAGKRTWRLFVSPVIDNGATTGAVIIFQDITEEEVLARSRDEFFSIASHELRTPLTAIKGNSSMMLEYYQEALKEPALHELAADIRESSDRLIDIVNDFLDASRLEQGRFTYKTEAAPLAPIAETVIYELSSSAKLKGLHVGLGTGFLDNRVRAPQALADRNRVKQILYNLIGNSIKFTESGSIMVDVTYSDSQAKVTVTDTGRGIAPNMQPLLFHKFQQAGESLLTRDTTRGTGLGLYISRLIAQGMHGDLILDKSEPGKGSSFAFTLPLAESSSHSAEDKHTS